MNRQEAVIDDAGQRKEVKGVHEHVIDLLVKLVKAFRSEIEEIGHLSALVISTNK